MPDKNPNDPKDMDVLLRDDINWPLFLIKVDGEDHYMKFEVFEVEGWDENDVASDIELYVTGTIKWDGCSHIWFGEKNAEGKQDGYLHLCGKIFWTRHAAVMLAIYELAEKTIKNYDKEIGA